MQKKSLSSYKAERNFIIFFLSLSSFSFLIMSVLFPMLSVFENSDADKLQSVYMIFGIIFWLTLIIGVVCQIIIKLRLKKTVDDEIKSKLGRIGLISFFRNKSAVVADTVFGLSVIAFIVEFAVSKGIGLMCYIYLSLLLFSFCLHCILNGRAFRYLTAVNKFIKNTGNQPKKDTKGEDTDE